MPFYCGKRSAGIRVVLGPKKSSTYSLGKERVLARLGRVGVVISYACGFSHPGLASARHLFFLATKDYSDRLLASTLFVRQRTMLKMVIIIGNRRQGRQDETLVCRVLTSRRPDTECQRGCGARIRGLAFCLFTVSRGVTAIEPNRSTRVEKGPWV